MQQMKTKNFKSMTSALNWAEESNCKIIDYSFQGKEIAVKYRQLKTPFNWGGGYSR